MKRRELAGIRGRVMKCGVLASFLAAALCLLGARSFATGPTKANSVELVGPVSPSIHVPPVRTAPPTRTRRISGAIGGDRGPEAFCGS